VSEVNAGSPPEQPRDRGAGASPAPSEPSGRLEALRGAWAVVLAGAVGLSRAAARAVAGRARGARAGLAWLAPRLAALRAWGARQASRRVAVLRALWSRWGGALTTTARLAATGGLLAALVLGVGAGFFFRVPVDRIAVRQARLGGAGVVAEDLGPGLHLQVPGRDAWHLLRRGTHLVAFDAEERGGTHPRLEVATVEGELCEVSVAVLYRIREGEAHRLVADGLKSHYPVRAVAICRRVLLEELGSLTAEDHADPAARARVEEAARARLAGELAVAHLEPVDVLLGEVLFAGTYEEKMLETQLASQGELTQAALLRREAEARRTEEARLAILDGEAAIARGYALEEEALRDASARALAELKAEALARREEALSATEVGVLRLETEAELAVAAAEALGETLRDEALQSEGGRLWVARRAAENLSFGKVTLDSRDPRVPTVLDLDGLAETLIGPDGR
jgi:hypothetical protein